MSDPSFSSATSVQDELIAGELDRVTETVTLITGENRTRGAVLGKITASGKWKLSAAAAVDGSEVPRAVLVKDCDATAADKDCSIYRTGEFSEAKLILGAGHTIASIREQLAAVGIFVKKLLSA